MKYLLAIRRVLLAAVALAFVLPASAFAKLMPTDDDGGPVQVVAAAGGGFDWADAAIGLGVGIAATIVVLGSVEYARHHMPHRPSGRVTHGMV